MLAATRALLSVRDRESAAAILLTAIRDLGGAAIPARLAEANRDALAVDVSLGVGAPLLVVVPEMSIAALHLGQHLAQLVQDSLSAAERCDLARYRSEIEDADPLSGGSSSAQVALSLSKARAGDVVAVLGLDRSPQLTDRCGPIGEQALHEFAELARASVRVDEFCGRYGAEKIMMRLHGAPVDVVRQRMVALVDRWRRDATDDTRASVGLAAVETSGGFEAVRTADEALLAAARAGGTCVVVFGRTA